MALDDLVDVPPVARLRPAPLVVPSRHGLRLVRDLHQLRALQAVHEPALAADVGDERRLTMADEPGERRQIQLGGDRHGVGDRIGDRQGAPEVVETGGEDGHAPRALALEAVVGDWSKAQSRFNKAE